MKNLLILTISLFISLLLGEMVLRLAPVEDPYLAQKNPVKQNGYIRSQFQPNAEFKFSTEDGLPGFNAGITTFSTNEYGFRGAPIKDGEQLIFTVGGSTTECLYLNDDQHWPFLLQKDLNDEGIQVNIQNAGKSGDAIDDHLSMIAHRIVHLNPDMIILYFGINDLMRLVCNDNPYKFDKMDDELPIHKLFLSELQLFRRLHNIFSKNENKSQIAFKSDYAKKVAHIQSFPETRELPPIDSSYFKRKLKMLVDVCKSTGAEIVFIPQLTTWHSKDEQLKNWHWMTEICGKRYDRETLTDLMDYVNGMIVKAGMEHDITVIQPYLEPDTRFFYDDCHFNPEGSEAFARVLLDSLRGKFNSSFEAKK